MSGNAPNRGTRRWSAELAADIRKMWEGSCAKSLGIGESDLGRILEEVAAKYLPESAGLKEARTLFESLRLDELVLARACAAGHDAAWEQFLGRFREKLYGAAYYIAKEDTVARELADSLYASLYGLNERDGKRVSKLASYMGRGSLEGWLRTVLAQEYVNRYRSQRRLVSLEEEEEAGRQFTATQSAAPQNGDARISGAVDDALAGLAEEERFCLASYFLDGKTLAEIARTLGVHESTISRKLEKITRNLRSAVVAALVRRGMDRRAAQEALETDVRDLAVDVRARLDATRNAGSGK